MIKQTFVAITLASACVVVANSFAYDDSRAASEERTAPIGKVKITAGTDTAKADANQVKLSPEQIGKNVYNRVCAACHAAGVAGAPRKGNKADWARHVKKGFDTIWKNALKGINAMPARGTCTDCSDDDIKYAIQHMLPKG